MLGHHTLEAKYKGEFMTKLNCDMGESFGIYRAGNDEEIMPLIDVANVACGFHASDPNHMRKTVELAKKHNTRLHVFHLQLKKRLRSLTIKFL